MGGQSESVNGLVVVLETGKRISLLTSCTDLCTVCLGHYDKNRLLTYLFSELYSLVLR